MKRRRARSHFVPKIFQIVVLLYLQPLLFGVSFDKLDEWFYTKKMKRLLSLVLVACVAAGPMNDPLQEYKNLNCFEQNEVIGSCFLVKTINYLNKASRSNDIGVIDGVTFVRNTPSMFVYLFNLSSCDMCYIFKNKEIESDWNFSMWFSKLKLLL